MSSSPFQTKVSVGVSLTAPLISGDPNGDPTASDISYQWQLSTDAGNTWTDIAGATQSEYIVQDSDLNNLLRVAVSGYTDGDGFSAENITQDSPLFSNPTDPVTAAPPVQGVEEIFSTGVDNFSATAGPDNFILFSSSDAGPVTKGKNTKVDSITGFDIDNDSFDYLTGNQNIDFVNLLAGPTITGVTDNELAQVLTPDVFSSGTTVAAITDGSKTYLAFNNSTPGWDPGDGLVELIDYQGDINNINIF